LNATSSVPSPSICTKIVGGWGFTPDPTGGAYSAPLPRHPNWIKEVILLRGGWRGRGRGRGKLRCNYTLVRIETKAIR